MGTKGTGESILNEDVVADDESALPTAVNARTLAMQAIEQDNLRRFEDETGIKVITDDTPPVDDQLAQQLTAPAPEPTPEPEPPAPEIRRVKVEGVEKEVSIDDLVATYQKNAAADARLRRATEMLREAEQLHEQLRAQPATPTPEPTTTPNRDAVRSQVEAAVTKLFEGEQEAAVSTLTDLIANSQGGVVPTQPVVAPVDVDELTNQITERLATQAAFNVVKTDYPELLANKTLERLAGLQIDELVQTTGVPRSEAILTVADQMYRDLGKTKAGRTEPTPEVPPAPAQHRLENKQKLDPVPSASQAAAMPTTPEEPNPSDVIAAMAAQRLGQSLPRRTG